MKQLSIYSSHVPYLSKNLNDKIYQHNVEAK